ncbi:hypothetical protein Taro_018426 [Colocasia esculenta]|uniref:TRUD domain-containing protein n=1 Tax=Colocasia esculenta TaxID=4460 RepID=A0A843V2E0_COLES|nr:hypothetical protein [Colocasia esculenta]
MRRNGKKRKARVDNRSEGDKPFDSRGSNSWPEHLGKFLRFHLYKENKDTQEALGVIGKMLGIQQRSFGFAGTKDKRAVTTQRVTVFKQHAKKLAALNNRLIGIKIGDFHYVKEGLVLGQLSGNQFTIVLRGIVADSDDTIKVAAGALGRKGFINYYGLQRFGSGSIPTHLIGAALLRGEWKVAIREAREYYKESGDVEGTLKQLPRYLVAERAILYCLKKCPGNNLQALKAIPRPLRMMYVHSYQSYLWNHAATMRVQKYGVDQVVLGDLVYCKSGSSRKLVKDNFVEPQDVSYTDIDNDDENEPYDSALLEENVPLVIKEEDLTEGVYAFEDVILPLPGSRVIYPENDVADVYRKLSDKAILLFFIFICYPLSYSFRELVSYTDDSMPLVETDLDAISRRDPTGIMENSSCGNSCSARENTSQQNPGQDHHDKKLDGSVERTPHVDHVCSSGSQSPQMALKLAFTLPASCYATMAIRELLKSSTSRRHYGHQEHRPPSVDGPRWSSKTSVADCAPVDPIEEFTYYAGSSQKGNPLLCSCACSSSMKSRGGHGDDAPTGHHLYCPAPPDRPGLCLLWRRVLVLAVGDYIVKRYLVEADNGDLLQVEKKVEAIVGGLYKYITVGVRVFRLEQPGEGEGEAAPGRRWHGPLLGARHLRGLHL